MELLKNVAQILFWVLTSVLASLAYFNAKKTLLSPVNTEYQKRIFDKLEILSKKLFSELKIGDDNYWLYQRPMKEVFTEICNEYKNNKESVHEFGLEISCSSVGKNYIYFQKLADEIRYELFLPDALKEPLISYLEQRAEAEIFSTAFAVDSYINMINENKNYEEIDEEKFMEIENFYIDGMSESGFDNEAITTKNKEIMDKIINYVQSFNPNPLKTRILSKKSLRFFVKK